MTSTPSVRQPETVGELIQRALDETEHSQAELAEAVQVPPEYIADIISGRRTLPRPARTDLYQGITSFLKLGRSELLGCADAERALAEPKPGVAPGAKVRKALLALCEPNTAKRLESDRTKKGLARFADLAQRLLDAAQRAALRQLTDQVSIRGTAKPRSSAHIATRFKVLEFLDATPETLTTSHVTEFMRPVIDYWDVDIETGVLRVVLRPQKS